MSQLQSPHLIISSFFCNHSLKIQAPMFNASEQSIRYTRLRTSVMLWLNPVFELVLSNWWLRLLVKTSTMGSSGSLFCHSLSAQDTLSIDWNDLFLNTWFLLHIRIDRNWMHNLRLVPQQKRTFYQGAIKVGQRQGHFHLKVDFVQQASTRAIGNITKLFLFWI